MLQVTADIQIPYSEIEFSYVRSSGPGGQNVNKVNSKCLLRWNVLTSPSLSVAVRARFIGLYRARLTSEGDVLLNSDRFRDQKRNQEDCLAKLAELILAAAHPPRQRKKTKPSRSSVRRNEASKKAHSDKKAQRRTKY